MTSQKKTALIFLSVINLINLAAGVITQLTMAFGWDVTSIIPIKAEITIIQILLFNFLAIVAIMTAICIITVYLVTDVAYSFGEILLNCPGISLVVPVALLFAAVYNTVLAQNSADRILIMVSAVLYIVSNIINFGCVFTIRYDAE